jgi:hypothetical protein
MSSIPWAGNQANMGAPIPPQQRPANQQAIMALADEAQEMAAGLSAQEKKERYEPPGDSAHYPAPGVAQKPKDELYRIPNDNPPRNIISEGTPNDLPDRNNIRTPAPQPKFEGSNPAGYGDLRDGARKALKAYR